MNRDRRREVPRPQRVLLSERDLRTGLLNREDAGRPWEQLATHNGDLLIAGMVCAEFPLEVIGQRFEQMLRDRGDEDGLAGGAEISTDSSVNLIRLRRYVLAALDPEQAAQKCIDDLGPQCDGRPWRPRPGRPDIPGTWRLDEGGSMKSYRSWQDFGTAGELERYERVPVERRSPKVQVAIALCRWDLEVERMFSSLLAVDGVVRNLSGGIAMRGKIPRGAGFRNFPSELMNPGMLATVPWMLGGTPSGSMLSTLFGQLVERTGIPTGWVPPREAARRLEELGCRFAAPLRVEHYRDGGILTTLLGTTGGSTPSLPSVYIAPGGDWQLSGAEIEKRFLRGPGGPRLIQDPTGGFAAYTFDSDRERGGSVQHAYMVEQEGERQLVVESKEGRVVAPLRPRRDVEQLTEIDRDGTRVN